MDDLTDTRHISRLEIVDAGRRRRWSAAEKLRIVTSAITTGIAARREIGMGAGLPYTFAVQAEQQLANGQPHAALESTDEDCPG